MKIWLQRDGGFGSPETMREITGDPESIEALVGGKPGMVLAYVVVVDGEVVAVADTLPPHCYEAISGS